MSRSIRILTRAAKGSIIIGLALILVSCSLPKMSGVPDKITPTPTRTPTPAMTPPLPTPADPRLQGLIDIAKADLARRLTLAADQIVLLEASGVVWPDASLGCPEEGMVYAQVLSPGYLILLGAGGQEYEYHTSTRTTVLYCENPTPPFSRTPSDI